MSSRRLEDVLKTFWRRSEDVLTRHLEDVSKTFWRCLEDVLRTSWKGLEDVMARRLEYILKTSWRRLEDVWRRWICWSWPRSLEDVFKTSSKDLWLRRIYSSEDKDKRRLQDFFIKTNVCWEDSNSLQRLSKKINFEQMHSNARFWLY